MNKPAPIFNFKNTDQLSASELNIIRDELVTISIDLKDLLFEIATCIQTDAQTATNEILKRLSGKP